MTKYVAFSDVKGAHILLKTTEQEDGTLALCVALDDAIDPTTNALTTIDYGHHEIHSGSHFCYSNAVDMTNAQVLSFLVVTPNTTKWAHFGFNLDGQAEYGLDVYIDATPDTVGAEVSAPGIINNNNNSSTVPTVKIYESPTQGGGSKGTLISRHHAGSGKSNGGVAGSGNERILKQNTKYWVDLTNHTTSNNFIGWNVEWYEHIDKG